MFKLHHSLIVWKRLEDQENLEDHEKDDSKQPLNPNHSLTHSLLPDIFKDFFKKNNSIHTYFTKQSTHMHLYGAKSSPKVRSIRTIGANIYNYFHDKLSMDCKLMTYKFHLKRYLIDNDVTFLNNIRTI